MLNKVLDINKLASDFLYDPEGFIRESEKSYHRSLEEIAYRLAHNDERRDVLLLSGPSSSGKSTSASLIREYLHNEGIDSIAMSTDDFFFDRDELDSFGTEIDLEASTIVNERLLQAKISELMECGEAYLPSFDFVSGRKIYKEQKDSLGKNGIIIIEGIHALNKQVVNPDLDIDTVRVYISLASSVEMEGKIVSGRNLRFARRSVRDSKFRGASFAETTEMWSNICIGEDKNITPYIDTANYIVDTFMPYELFVLKKDFVRLFEEAKASDSDIANIPFIRNLIELYSRCPEADVSLLPERSLIREFVGGGIYG